MTGTMIVYIVQNRTQALIAIVNAEKMRLLFKVMVPYLMFNHIKDAFDVFSRNKDGLAPILQIYVVKINFGSVSEEEEMAVEKGDKSAAFNEALRHAKYL